MENKNEILLNLVDFSMYDGMGNPRIHLKAYLDSLVGMEQENKLKMRLFVRTLTGPALMWYAKQDAGMLGHTTDECHCLKEEIQRLLNNGKIIQRPMTHPQFIWYHLQLSCRSKSQSSSLSTVSQSSSSSWPNDC
ncbi:hypothetical protein HAX54_041086 [Datura stramonium]|uniref:Retrotransposon gag domain-containing protein n=1 Tax=Datura stramonium TaxID=4076 RepID=A0ABS8RNG3_DATST|nr:hypothetical protein [Datura stramonium]